MKKIITPLLSLFLVGPMVAPAQNLLTNGSFEQDLTGWFTQASATDGAAATFTIETTDVKSGTKAFRTEVTTPGTNPWSTQAFSTIDWKAKPGTDYKLSLFAKSVVAGGSLRIINQKAGGGNYWPKDETLTADWKEYSYTYTPADTAIQFALNFRSAGTFLIDSITITAIPVVTPDVEPDSLRSLIAGCGIPFGTAVADAPLQAETFYQNTLKQHFNIVTAENAMKMDAIKPSETGDYNFTAGDRLVAFAQANNQKVRGHALVWHSQIPQWVTDKAWTKETLFAYLKEYITTVVSHYKGKVAEWDVVNEAVGDDNILRNSVYFKTLGVAVFDSAFAWAHAADPDALLFYNDYNTEALNTKSDSAFKLVSGLVQRKAPIDGVGFQTHRVAGQTYFPISEIDSNIKRYVGLGLKVAFTEIDIRVPVPATEESYVTQAKDYAQILRIALNNKSSVTSFVVWGVSDKYSWIPNNNPGEGDALLFDVNYNAKPAYDSVVAVLKTACDNVTAVEGDAIAEVMASFPNPFSSTTMLHTPGSFTYYVYDAKGTEVANGQGNQRAEIGADLASGLYSVVIRRNDDSKTKTVKIVKSLE